MKNQLFFVGVKALIVNEENQILVLSKNPLELDKYTPPHWDIPGGRIQNEKDLIKALKREIREELGDSGLNIEIVKLVDCSLSNLSVRKLVKNKNYLPLLLITYLCNFTSNNSEFKIGKEHTKYEWVSISEAKKLLSVKFSKSFIDKLDQLE